jgi:hypothetical protein
MAYLGPLFLRTVVYPLGLILAGGVSRSIFEPQAVPKDYMRRAAIRLVLRPKTFFANARDLALLERFIATQVPRYVDLRTPITIITGDRDTMVEPKINACALADLLPQAKLVYLQGVGHMPHYAAPETVVAAIDELAPTQQRRSRAKSADYTDQAGLNAAVRHLYQPISQGRAARRPASSANYQSRVDHPSENRKGAGRQRLRPTSVAQTT